MKNKVFFPNLDSLRTIACFSVFASHSMLSSPLKDLWENPHYHRFLSFLFTGGNGVSFFFVLSGFLITYLILLEEYQNGKINLGKFYVRRFLRIWPLFYFVVFFGFFIYPALKVMIGMSSNIPNVLPYYIFFLSNFDSIYLAGNNLTHLSPMMLNITWSVSIEEQFYLFWPIFFIALPKKYYQLIFFTVISVSLIFTFYHQSDENSILYYHTLAVMADLSLGGLCAYYAIYNKQFIDFFKKLSRKTIITIYIIGILYFMYRNLIDLPYFFLCSRLLSTCFFAFIIMEQNYAEHSLIKYGQIKILSKLGKYTYSMYMLHPIGIQMTIILYRLLHISFEDSILTKLLYVFIALIFSLVLSFLSFHFYESYFLRLKTKYQTIKQ